MSSCRLGLIIWWVWPHLCHKRDLLTNDSFGLFGLSNRSAAIIGPNVIQPVVDKGGNNWKAFAVLFVLGALGCLMARFGVNVPKERDDGTLCHGEATGGYRHGIFGREGCRILQVEEREQAR